jgi:hypothetical protein
MALVERYNEAAALLALDSDFIETRIVVSIQPEDTVYRYTRDTRDSLVDTWLFTALPYFDVGSISSSDGSVADTMTITMDGADMVTVPYETPDSVLQTIISYPLRDRPIQVGLLVLDPDTRAVIGLIPQFVGFVDNVPLLRDRNTRESKLEFNCASFRAYAQRRVARTYSDTDHQSRFVGDGGLKWMSDAVFRNGKYAWNTTSATGAGAGSGGGGGLLGIGFGFVAKLF